MCSNKRSKAVVNFFFKKAKEDFCVDLTCMKVLKLSYISHGWNLAINGDPLIDDVVQAWKFGPIIPSIYYATKKYGSKQILTPIFKDGDASYLEELLDAEKVIENNTPVSFDFSEDEIAVMDAVWGKYKNLSGIALSLLTHQQNTPWFNAWDGYTRDVIIPDQNIKEFYIEQAS